MFTKRAADICGHQQARRQNSGVHCVSLETARTRTGVVIGRRGGDGYRPFFTYRVGGRFSTGPRNEIRLFCRPHPRHRVLVGKLYYCTREIITVFQPKRIRFYASDTSSIAVRFDTSLMWSSSITVDNAKRSIVTAVIRTVSAHSGANVASGQSLLPVHMSETVMIYRQR